MKYSRIGVVTGANKGIGFAIGKKNHLGYTKYRHRPNFHFKEKD
jgi:hypothetical protein